jgi:hypothetical protein
MQQTSSPSTSLWALVGKVGALLALMWIVIQAVSLYKSNANSLEITGEKYPIKLPDSIAQNLGKVTNSLIPYKSADIFPGDSRGSDLVRIVGEHLKKNGLEELNQDLSNLKFAWLFTISNPGDKEIADLKLELPFKGKYIIDRPGDKKDLSNFDGSISLGSIRPSHQFVVNVWSDYDGDYSKTIQATHPNGFVKVNFAVLVAGLSGWLVTGGHLKAVVFVVVLLMLGVFILGCVIGRLWLKRA